MDTQEKSPVMNPSTSGDKPVLHPSADQLWAEAQAVAASELLSRSPRVRALLLFLAEQTAAGHYDQLSEFEVGRHVYRKDADWVPNEDSIVRSSVRQLRLKLAEFYAQEGARRPWRLEIPRGSYVVSLLPGPVQPERPEAPEPLPTPLTAEIPVLPPPTRRRWAVPLVATVLTASLIANVILFTRQTPGEKPPVRAGLAGALVSGSTQPTRVVLDDFAHVLFGSLTGFRHGTVEDYASREYASPERMPSEDPGVKRVWNLLATRHIVSLGAVASLDRLLRSTPDPSKLIMVHARNITARDFRNGNSIIVGTEPNNPWSGMFDADVNFRRGSLADGRVGFYNTNPRPGEEPVYATEKNASVNSGQGVARIVYRSNGAGGFVLLLSGVNMVTTEAAGEFVSNPARLDEVLRLFDAKSAAELPYMEILLRTTAVDNSVRGASVIATRRLN